MPYVSDRMFSKIYENDYLLKLNNISINNELMEGNVIEFDIKNEKLKYEIKACRYALTTHNICIEFEFKFASGWGASGITSSTADIWIYYVVNKNDKSKIYEYYYEIPSQYIKDLINEKKWKKKQKGGDGYKSHFYLFDDSLFAQFKRL